MLMSRKQEQNFILFYFFFKQITLLLLSPKHLGDVIKTKDKAFAFFFNLISLVFNY